MPSKKEADAVDAHVGQRIRFRRIMLGHSQGDLAKALGLTFQQVQKYEKGTNRIGASRLFAIASFLRIPLKKSTVNSQVGFAWFVSGGAITPGWEQSWRACAGFGRVRPSGIRPLLRLVP